MKTVFPLALAAILSLAAIARADSVALAGNRYDGTLNGIKDGKLSITIQNIEHLYDLSQLQSLDLEDAPKLAAAEEKRSSNPKEATAIYKQVLNTVNNPEVRLLIELRDVAPTEADGRFSDAVVLFLDVYQSHPDDSVWQFHPKQLPAQGSQMLATAADAVNAAIKSAKTTDARRNLQLFLLDIYNRAGNTQAAASLATLLKTGIPDQATASSAGIAPDLATALAKIDSQLLSKQFSGALQSADTALSASPAPPAEAAVQLFTQKARALEGLDKPEDAAAAWLRIPAHFPTSPAIPSALLRAATLEKSLHHDASTAALYDELKSKYPSSPEAAAGH